MHQMSSESTLVRAAVARMAMTPYDAVVCRGRFKASLLEEGMSGGPRLEAIMSIFRGGPDSGCLTKLTRFRVEIIFAHLWGVVTYNFVSRTSPDWRVARQTRLNHVKEALLRRLHAVSVLLVPGRLPEALVSILTLFYYLGHIGVIAMHFPTKLRESIFQYV